MVGVCRVYWTHNFATWRSLKKYNKRNYVGFILNFHLIYRLVCMYTMGIIKTFIPKYILGTFFLRNTIILANSRWTTMFGRSVSRSRSSQETGVTVFTKRCSMSQRCAFHRVGSGREEPRLPGRTQFIMLRYSVFASCISLLSQFEPPHAYRNDLAWVREKNGIGLTGK